MSELLNTDIEAVGRHIDPVRDKEKLAKWFTLRSDLNLVYSNYQVLRLVELGSCAEIRKNPYMKILHSHKIVAKAHCKRNAFHPNGHRWVVTDYCRSLMNYIETWGWLDPK